MANPTDERIEHLLSEVCSHFEDEDLAVRQRQIRKWKKLKYYWDGFLNVWWDDVAHDWRVLGVDNSPNDNGSDAGYYDKSINVFRAYLESIIAALSVTVPGVKCFPDDADNPQDMATARAGDKIARLVSKHNNDDLLWLHALFIRCTEGMVAAYNYTDEDESYGTYAEPKYDEVEEDQDVKICPNCQGEIPDGTEELDNRERDEFDPDSDDAGSHSLLAENEVVCPTCLAQVDPDIQKKKLIVTRLIGITTKPKARQCVECYGGLYIKVANYAKKQKDTPYLIFAEETSYAKVVTDFPKMRDKFGDNKIQPGSMDTTDPYEAWGRLSTQYLGVYPTDTVTVKKIWLRPCAFNTLHAKDDADFLLKHYPDGARVIKINDTFCEAENESLDDHWTLTEDPLADYLYHEPLGSCLTGIQEITTELMSLILQTIEHGIPQTFADPGVLNFDQYKQLEVLPGAIIPTKQAPGKNIADGFYEVRTASLSAEVQPFLQKVQEFGQVVSGAMPSLFGGAAPNSSKTAAQYSMSRAQSLQRLQTTWKVMTNWWKNIYGKVIPAYIDTIVDDERLVEKDEAGNFINSFIRKSELDGKIGQIELEASEQLPMTWAQKRDTIMQIFQSNNPEMLQAFGALSPENIPLLAEIIGLDDFAIPGLDDRQKQYEEIQLLCNSTPIPDPNDPTGEGPSIDPEPIVDNGPIHIAICKEWLVSDPGRLAKVENPQGYKNVILHLQRHMNILQAQSMPPAGSMPQPNQQQQKPAQGPNNG